MRETEDKAVRCFTDEVEMGNQRRRQMLNPGAEILRCASNMKAV